MMNSKSEKKIMVEKRDYVNQQ